MDVYKDINRERVSRQQTVSRFLTEYNWYQKNTDAADANKWWAWSYGVKYNSGHVR